MNTTAAPKVTLRNARTERDTYLSSRGRRDLSRFDVLVDGVKVGQVYQHRSSTRQRYSGRMYGYDTTRTCWAWDADMMGGTEMATRKEALADLLSMVDLAARKAARRAELAGQ